jgi:regulation of enolase protein 1 (concanavalin A-like superfamily)
MANAGNVARNCNLKYFVPHMAKMDYNLLNAAHSAIKKTNGAIEIIAPSKTDYYCDICSNYKILNAPFYYTNIEGDFIFRCKVKPEFHETYDAGGIIAYDSEKKWVKYAFEKTDLGYPSIVSVITVGLSDDCNGEIINENEIWMQIVRSANNWCLHYSKDKVNWKMVRYFRLDLRNNISIGIFSQSPIGEGCKVHFSEIELLNQTYKNIRKAE